ncbi:E3 ubiquitin-protein ligase znrf2-like [Labeo rohita]|uniref:E3 ubiquitin-protein ligase znrf2-like n=1 Tax=Labeo rohita TaxID=84645 RepID=UPI0021E2F415|nr:E3 ubiquitin-protein ligase znrf2-like [Labeo rohita]
MGPKQSIQSAGVRVRSYSGSDLNFSDGRAAVLRFYAGGSTGQIGERFQYSPQRPRSFTHSGVIPIGGRRDETDGQRTLLIGSLPAHLTPHMLGAGFDCPVCSKFVCSDEIEDHLLMCFSKPRLHYNDDVLSRESGECSICLEDMIQGDTIARLPCLCVYHKGCIDEWFEVNRSCPEHPTD